MTVEESIGAVMRLMRELQGCSLRAYAKRIGVSPATLSRIENDKGCDLATLAQLSKGTHVSYAMLLGERKLPGNGSAPQ